MIKPKVFIGADNQPYMLKEIQNEVWVHYLHPDNKWVTLKRIDQNAFNLIPDNLTELEQSAYPEVDG